MVELSGGPKIDKTDATVINFDNLIDNHKERVEQIPETKDIPPFVFSFEDIAYKNVLHSVSNSLESGKMTAILGPSGAGKTTLLKIISGRKRQTRGVISSNGHKLSSKQIRKQTAYVHQENHLLPLLKVKEMLEYTIKLKAPKEEDPGALADTLLKTLDLYHVKDTRIGDPIQGSSGISGGEMKRLSVAQELISMPNTLFLDEPTSGLDSKISESLLLHMKNLARSGMLVALTIHQPSSDIFHMFDNIILMRSGNIIYSGSVPNCIVYLEQLGHPCPKYTNPADHIFRVFEHFPSSPTHMYAGEQTKVPKHRTVRHKKTTYTQIARETRIIISRNFICGVRNKKYLLAKVSQAMVIGMVTSILLYNIPGQIDHQQETNTLGCFWAISMGIFGSFSYGAVSVLFSDRKLFIKEYSSNYYSFTAYFIAKVVVDFIITCVHPLVAVPMILLSARIGSIMHIVTCLLLGAVGHSLGLMVASLLDSVEIALAVFPAVVYPINMLTGTAVDTESIVKPLKFVQYLSPTRHAYNIMVKLHYRGETDVSPKIESQLRTFLSIEESFCVLLCGYVVLILLASFFLKRKVLAQTKR
ncbi:hypothetical protein NEDG_00990 [Nematocida displodere]|uniref:ABC transporter domain-containing protein n=1 Tax=Nematocida displodere TaxID=1805483 RepID=A0A177EBH2_9MICR|nr:hypothetical protein NEDG_00990 [Nematocida displodere]